ncbi:helix-turn-helix domain-containing protein [Aureimonas sp. AU40]|uniref:helix-turn-helix domain-containing protein n=1 Tax=Aureimonas sp. AU40 TaxID=1637747 RepID=UPI000784562A|nr:helix-turn-helix domain-containing protein [Aureimonas sp. AU40]
MNKPISRLDLQSSKLGRQAALATWKAALPQYEISLGTDLDDFWMDLSAWLLRKVVFTHGQTSPTRLERHADRLSDGYDNFIFVHFMKGRWQGEADGKPFTLNEGEVILLDGSRPFHGLATASSYAMVNVPRAVLIELAPSLPLLHGRVLHSASGWLLADHLAALSRALPLMHQGEAERMANATLTLMAACVGNLTDRAQGDMGSLIPAVRLRVERHVERNLTSPDLTPQTLCRDLQIPRSTLYRAFSAFGGISAYIQSRRLDAARAILFHPEDRRSVEEISRHLGFGNATSFARSFQRRFGCTPREARRNGSTFVASSQVLFERWQSVLRANA